MSGSPLISVPPAPASPPNAVTGADDWWPGIDRNAARDALRLGEIITDARLIMALQGAMLTVAGDLAQWQAELVAMGAANLTVVTVEHLLAMRIPTEPRFPDQNSRFDCWVQPGTFPYGPGFNTPRYSPARAQWLAAPLDGGNRLGVIYTRAVRCAAAAELVELSRDIGATHMGDVRAEARMDPAAEYRRLAAEGIRDIVGRPRSTVDLV